MAKRAKRTTATKTPPKEVEFDFIKSAFFRVVKGDGFFGGLTPSGGNVHMGVYSERSPFPQKVVHELNGAQLGDEMMDRRVGRKAIVRELEVGVSMDIATAVVLRQWLDDKLEQYEKLIGPLPVVATEKGGSSKANGSKAKR